jgi:hypothetical protein
MATTKSGKKKKLTPVGFWADKDTGDGRNTNPTKNRKRKWGNLF